MERMLRVPLFTVIVFNRPFVDNTEYVKYCVARACRIWEFSYDDQFLFAGIHGGEGEFAR